MTVFVGVDVGGTKTAIGVVQLPDARVLRRIELPTPPREATGRPFLENVSSRALALADDACAVAIGISLCELVAPDGQIGSDHRVLWQDISLGSVFAGRRPVVIEADVRSGAAAEARYGAGRGFRDHLYVNLGTGISSCWVRDRRPHKGAHGHALLLASSPVDAVCAHCGEPISYVPEQIAGAAGLVSRYRACGGEAVSAHDVFRLAGQGDRRAINVVDAATLALAVSIGLAVNILDPQALVLGGGLALAGGAYGEPLEARIRDHIWSPETRTLAILRAALGADSALIGAACLARDLVEGV